MKTFSAKKETAQHDWVLIDAEGQTLGRMSAEIAHRLRGKHKAEFTSHVDTGDYIVVVNAEKVKVTGKKATDKMYHHHSQYPGGLKSHSSNEMIARNPEEVIRLAVKGMLPKNKLGRKGMKNLRVCLDQEHGHEAQKPQPAKPRLVTGE